MAELRNEFNLFVYGTLQGAPLLSDCELIGRGHVGGVLYNVDGSYPALVLYGATRVAGEVWRCPHDKLPLLDDYEGVDENIFRRIGVEVPLADNSVVPCWTYVAGPALAHKLTPEQRIARWSGGE